VQIIGIVACTTMLKLIAIPNGIEHWNSGGLILQTPYNLVPKDLYISGYLQITTHPATRITVHIDQYLIINCKRAPTIVIARKYSKGDELYTPQSPNSRRNIVGVEKQTHQFILYNK